MEKHAFSERLIDEIEKERVLWDMASQLYKANHLKEVAWRRVATSMGCSVGEVKARWKNLRDSFRRVFKARNPIPKSGAGAEDGEIDDSAMTWLFYDRLLFLKDTIVGRPTSGNLEQLPTEDSSSTDQEATPGVTAESVFTEMMTETSSSSELEADELNKEASTSSRVGANGKRSMPRKICQPEGSARKRRKPYKNEIDSLASIVTKKPDEAECFGQIIACKLRRCPGRLREAMELDLLTTASKYLHERISDD